MIVHRGRGGWGDTGRSVSRLAPTHEAHVALIQQRCSPPRIDALGDDASGRRSSHSGEQATRIMRSGAVFTQPLFGEVWMKASVRGGKLCQEKHPSRGSSHGRIARGFLKLSAESLAAPDPG